MATTDTDERTDLALSPPAACGVAAATLGLSALVGRRNAPDPSHPTIRRWYRRLDKPAFTPPDAAFGALWPVLEGLAAVGGYRLLRQPGSPARAAALALWLADSAMIGGWTELFFRQRRTGAMAAGTVALAATARKVDRTAAASILPLAGWLGFATILAGEIWRRNRRPTPLAPDLRRHRRTAHDHRRHPVRH